MDSTDRKVASIVHAEIRRAYDVERRGREAREAFEPPCPSCGGDGCGWCNHTGCADQVSEEGKRWLSA